MTVREFLKLTVNQKVVALYKDENDKFSSCTIVTKDGEVKHEELLDRKITNLWALDEDVISVCI